MGDGWDRLFGLPPGDVTGDNGRVPATKQLCRRAAMNTWFECLLLGDDSENLAAIGEAAMDEVERVERLLSRFDSASEVSRLNREAAKQPVLVSYELLAVLQTCCDYWKKTLGHFDPTAVSRALLPQAGFDFSSVQIDAAARQVRFASEGLFLDFGGFGKGYALDCAVKMLRHFGVSQALLHGGTSSVLALGSAEDGNDWEVGIREPSDPAREVGRVSLRDEALSSSAVFGPDQQISDIIHTHSGKRLAEQAACVVLAESATVAEIFSTAFLSMGKPGAAAFWDRKHLRVGWIEQAQENSSVVWVGGGS
jgi:thiamine biosynthesis lipoprotein